MSCYKIPTGLCNSVKSEIFKFWWSKHTDEKKIHWIKTEKFFEEKEDGGMGFRRWDWMNLALLAKQMWRILVHPDLLISKIFKAKYFPNVSPLECEVRRNSSYAWRSIKEAASILAGSFVWCRENKEWIWVKDSSGEYSVKTGYRAVKEVMVNRIREEGGETSDQKVAVFWRRLWRLRLPNKIKIFIWRCYHNGLPTRDNLVRRGVGVDNRCCFCGKKKETLIHLMMECWWGRALMQEMNLSRNLWENECREIGLWFWVCHEISDEEEFRRACIFCWLVWKSRNELIFEKKERSISEMKAIFDYLIHSCVYDLGTQIDWFCGETGNLFERVIYCDGSYCVISRRAGWGVVLEEEGRISQVVAGYDDHVESVVCAEGRAIWEGMKLAGEREVEEAIFCSDSLKVIQIIAFGQPACGVDLAWLKECRSWLKKKPGWRICYINREKNFRADTLALKARLERWCWVSAEAIPRVF